MKITKYGHACLFLEKKGQIVVIDPGCFTKLPSDLPTYITAIIITEEHADHFDMQNIKLLVKNSPSAKVFTTESVGKSLKAEKIDTEIISGDQETTIGDFELKFSETPHAPVYQTSPCQSLTVQINSTLYYPSDSYATTEKEVTVLALPLSGPWYKVSESIDFANAINSRMIITTHNGLNSADGDKVATHHIQSHLKDSSRGWHDLAVGESIEV